MSVAVTLGMFCLALLISLISSWEGSRQIKVMLRRQGETIAENLAAQSKLALLYDSDENVQSSVKVTLEKPCPSAQAHCSIAAP